MRILLDTNIVVAGLLSPKGPPGRLLRAWLRGRFEFVTSQEQLHELARVLRYKRLRTVIDREQARGFLENIDVLAIMATNLPEVDVSSDPADNMILATAVAGGAEVIVSGDKAGVLALRDVEGIPTITAREALERLGLIDE